MNNKLYHTLFLISFFCASQTVSALSLIETKQADGSIEKIYIDGLKVRIESGSEPGYVLIDGGKGSMFIVSSEEKQIVDMSHLMGQGKRESKSAYQIKFVNKGDGPAIAGYATKHYEIRVNGKKCADEFTSTKMPKDLGMEKAFEKISAMFNEPDMGMMPGMDACTKADEQISHLYSEYGYPMRSLDAGGNLESEVVGVKKKANMPSGGFDLPEGYQRVDMGKMMRGTPETRSERGRNRSPERQQQMQQMMEQMMEQMGRPQE